MHKLELNVLFCKTIILSNAWALSYLFTCFMYYFTFVILKCSKHNFDSFFFFRRIVYRSLLYEFWKKTKKMDVSRPKRKRKGFTTNLTISKKSKRYPKKTSDKHTTETTFLSTSEDLDTQSEGSDTGYLFPQYVKTSYFHRKNIKTFCKSNSGCLRTRQVAVQKCCSYAHKMYPNFCKEIQSPVYANYRWWQCRISRGQIDMCSKKKWYSWKIC